MRKNTEAQVSGGVADGSEEGSVMGLERSSDVVPTESVGQPGNGEEPAKAVKPFGIAKWVVWGSVPACQSQPGRSGHRRREHGDVRGEPERQSLSDVEPDE